MMKNSQMGKLGFKIYWDWYPIGSGYLLDAFFSTVAVNLENNNWGSRFPIIMNELNRGVLDYKHAKDALNELLIIKNELKDIPIANVIWDIDDKTIKGPVGYLLNANAENLSNYFKTSENADFIELLEKVISISLNMKKDVMINKLNDISTKVNLYELEKEKRYSKLPINIQQELNEFYLRKKVNIKLK